MNAFATVVSGRLSKFVVLGLWLVLAAVGGMFAATLVEVQNNDALGALPDSAETTKALDRAEEAFPGSNRLVAVVVYARDGGLTGADRAAVEADRVGFARYAEGGRLPDLVPSEDGNALLMSFPLAGDSGAQESGTENVHDLIEDGLPAGLRTGLTGSAGANMDVFDAFAGMDSTLLLTTGGVVVLILLVTYRSPVLWLLPLITVGIASQVASAAVYFLAKYADVAVDFQSQSVLTVIVFGVGRRLRAAAHRPVPGGATASREPARGDAGRVASLVTGDSGLGRYRRDRPSLPAGRGSAGDARPRPGRGRRSGHRVRGDDHSAAGAAGAVRTLAVLAVRPAPRSRRDRRGRPAPRLGPRGRCHRPVSEHDLAGDGRGAGGSMPGHREPERRAAGRGRVHQGGRLGARAEADRRTLSGRHVGALSVGVLLDTFLIRSLLVPALALSIGPAVWWPSRLGRRLGTSGEVAAQPQVVTTA